MDNPAADLPVADLPVADLPVADLPVADLLVVAGGGARRLGGADKAMLVRPDGRTLLAALLAAPASGRRVVVGPRREDVHGVDVWARESPPGGGPVAALAAGVPHLRAPVVLVLAGDLVDGAAAVPALVAALAGAADGPAAGPADGGGPDVAVVWHGDRPQWLLTAWRRDALVAALTRLGDPVGAPVRALYAGVRVARVDDVGRTAGGRGGGWSGDLDTPADVRRLLGPP